ncbi:MAG TPA: hypothetical protein VG076_00930 [Acidimicrobiales bacterium]|jgi:hypothetical protein|nr:hypothetical protein [Acidimicrobiales bacterium]
MEGIVYQTPPNAQIPLEGGEEVRDALIGLVEALQESTQRAEAAIAKADTILRLQAEGSSHREIVDAQERPLIIEMATANIGALYAAGARLRRAEARALHAEGMSMDSIAGFFGVTRQRISALLRSNKDEYGPSWVRRSLQG